MENPETQGTLGKQDTGRRQIKHQNTTQKNKKIKKMSNTDPIRTRCEAKILPLIAISDHLYDIKFKPVVCFENMILFLKVRFLIDNLQKYG